MIQARYDLDKANYNAMTRRDIINTIRTSAGPERKDKLKALFRWEDKVLLPLPAEIKLDDITEASKWFVDFAGALLKHNHDKEEAVISVLKEVVQLLEAPLIDGNDEFNTVTSPMDYELWRAIGDYFKTHFPPYIKAFINPYWHIPLFESKPKKQPDSAPRSTSGSVSSMPSSSTSSNDLSSKVAAPSSTPNRLFSQPSAVQRPALVTTTTEYSPGMALIPLSVLPTLTISEDVTRLDSKEEPTKSLMLEWEKLTQEAEKRIKQELSNTGKQQQATVSTVVDAIFRNMAPLLENLLSTDKTVPKEFSAIVKLLCGSVEGGLFFNEVPGRAGLFKFFNNRKKYTHLGNESIKKFDSFFTEIKFLIEDASLQEAIDGQILIRLFELLKFVLEHAILVIKYTVKEPTLTINSFESIKTVLDKNIQMIKSRIDIPHSIALALTSPLPPPTPVDFVPSTPPSFTALLEVTLLSSSTPSQAEAEEEEEEREDNDKRRKLGHF